MEELERTVDDKQEAVRVVEKKSQNMVSKINTCTACVVVSRTRPLPSAALDLLHHQHTEGR